MMGPPEPAAGEQIALLRSVGYAAFGRHERNLDVLDLVYDSLVDSPVPPTEGPTSSEELAIPGGSAASEGLAIDDVRRLRFAGHGVTLDVDVHGRADLTIELRVAPAGPVVVESRGGEAD